MPRDARTRLLDAAERLVAERGVDVPLREVALAAGQRNNSAVHYHFGSREGLLEAVLAWRLEPVNARMLAMLADLEASSDGGGAERHREPCALVDVLVRPMATEPYLAGSSHYARFLEQVRARPLIADLPAAAPEHASATRLVLGRLARTLPRPWTDERRAARLRALSTAMFALLADHERARPDLDEARAEAALDEIVTMLTGLLLTPTPG